MMLAFRVACLLAASTLALALRSSSSSRASLRPLRLLPAAAAADVAAPAAVAALDAASTLSLSLLRVVSKEEATGAFYFFFLAGSGALGIGAAQVPKIRKEYDEIAALKGLGGTKGGELLELGPLAGFGYPEPLAKADVLGILQNFPTVEEIAAKGKKRTFMEQQGYLSRQGFTDCYPADSTNQVALYAVFDALTGGGSSFVTTPSRVKELSAKWKAEGLDSFVSDLTKTQVGRVGGFAGLAFLIALIIDLVVESGFNAFLR